MAICASSAAQIARPVRLALRVFLDFSRAGVALEAVLGDIATSLAGFAVSKKKGFRTGLLLPESRTLRAGRASSSTSHLVEHATMRCASLSLAVFGHFAVAGVGLFHVADRRAQARC